jgi:hypothetical protein
VTFHIPLLGFILNYITTKSGMIFCIVIPMFMIVIYDITFFFFELNKYLKIHEARSN